MSIKFNRSIGILCKSTSRSPSHISHSRPFDGGRLTVQHPRRPYSTKSHDNLQSNLPPPPPPPEGKSYGARSFLSDLNLGYTLPISFIIGVGLYVYIQSQLPEGTESSGSTGRPLSSRDPLPPLIDLPKPDETPVLDPATQISFPSELALSEDSNEEPLRLIGVGVRTVSFLAVKVYSAGFYADPRVLRSLRVIPGWSTDVTKEKLLSSISTPKLPSTTTESDDVMVSPDVTEQVSTTGENLMRNLLSAPVDFAIRIAPARSTDFTHLRDGFCRSLTARISRAVKQGHLSEIEADRASESINHFRTFFPTGISVPKGKSLLLRKTSTGSLLVEYDGQKLGELVDPLIARELFLAYFADVDPISIKFKEAVAEGFEKIYR